MHGLIFLFKWQQGGGGGGGSPREEEAGGGGDGSGRKALVGDDCPPGLFFARQVTHNACATQAILSVLFNAPNSIVGCDDDGEGGDDSKARDCDDDDGGRKLILGETLSNFKSFTSHFPPDLRGEAIGSSDEIRTVHNSFGRAEDAFLSDPSSRPKRAATDDDDVFHFVAYVPHDEDGCVYELDGLQPGPIRVGSYKNKKEEDEEGGGGGGGSNGTSDDMDWMRVARDAIQLRLTSYASSEIKFNLMAVVQDRRTVLGGRMSRLAESGVDVESDPDALRLRSELHAEDEKRARWMAENARRRHNYLPFCVELLRSLAGSGKFEKLIEDARASAGEKRKRAEAWKARQQQG